MRDLLAFQIDATVGQEIESDGSEALAGLSPEELHQLVTSGALRLANMDSVSSKVLIRLAQADVRCSSNASRSSPTPPASAEPEDGEDLAAAFREGLSP